MFEKSGQIVINTDNRGRDGQAFTPMDRQSYTTDRQTNNNVYLTAPLTFETCHPFLFI